MARETVAAGHAEYTPSSLQSWLMTTDHKRIGILYICSALGFFLLAVIAATLMRTQTAVAQNNILGPDAYNQAFTMHGTTMVFLVGHAGADRLRQLRRAPDDRGPRYGLPQAERLQLLALSLCRAVSLEQLSVRGSPRRRLVRLRSTDLPHLLARPQHGLLGPGHPATRRIVHRQGPSTSWSRSSSCVRQA